MQLMQFVGLQIPALHFRVHISASISIRITCNFEIPCLFVDKVKMSVELLDFGSRQVWNFSSGHHFADISFRV
jgi:hypothetical protein